MKSGKVRMRMDACVKAIDEQGASTAKQVASHLGYGATWALPFLKELIANGELVITKQSRPQIYDLPPEARGLETYTYEKDMAPTKFEITLPRHTILTLTAMAQIEEVEVELLLQDLINRKGTTMTRDRRISLTSIVEEMLRHEKEMARLAKGYGK